MVILLLSKLSVDSLTNRLHTSSPAFGTQPPVDTAIFFPLKKKELTSRFMLWSFHSATFPTLLNHHHHHQCWSAAIRKLVSMDSCCWYQILTRTSATEIKVHQTRPCFYCFPIFFPVLVSLCPLQPKGVELYLAFLCCCMTLCFLRCSLKS